MGSHAVSGEDAPLGLANVCGTRAGENSPNLVSKRARDQLLSVVSGGTNGIRVVHLNSDVPFISLLPSSDRTD